MKKILYLLLILVSLNIFQGCSSISTINTKVEGSLEELNYEDVADKLIRFHVIANSDSKEDQELKLKVRDKVIASMSDKLKDVSSLDEARAILTSSIEEVNLIAKQVIVENNYSYDVQTIISKENFPDKVYGNYIFPQGEYEAFRIIIGSGQGKNWWCVMFPPLCFVDESKNSVKNDELEKNINKSLTSSSEEKKENSKKDLEETKKLKDVNNSELEEEKSDNKQESVKEEKVVLKFKMVELIKKIF